MTVRETGAKWRGTRTGHLYCIPTSLVIDCEYTGNIATKPYAASRLRSQPLICRLLNTVARCSLLCCSTVFDGSASTSRPTMSHRRSNLEIITCMTPLSNEYPYLGELGHRCCAFVARQFTESQSQSRQERLHPS